jgi:hypothetical protein
VTRTARSAPRLAELAAGVFYAWNPYVAERLILGHWALLLGYAVLPWVVAAVARREPGIRLGELAAALIPAAVGGFEAVGICALAAVPAALAAQPGVCPPRCLRPGGSRPDGLRLGGWQPGGLRLGGWQPGGLRLGG